MTTFAQPFRHLIVVDHPLRGRVVTEGTLILPATNPGMRAILEGIGADAPGVYFYVDEGGKPKKKREEVPAELREGVYETIAESTDLPRLTLGRSRDFVVRDMFGVSVPDFARKLHGDGYIVRMAEGPIQLATACGHQQFGRFCFFGAGRETGVTVTTQEGDWLGILLPMRGHESDGAS